MVNANTLAILALLLVPVAIVSLIAYNIAYPGNSLMFLAITGQTPKENANTITISFPYGGTKCDVLYSSSGGEQTESYNVCENVRFTSPNECSRLVIESVSRGRVESMICKRAKTGGGAGYEFRDYATDDLDWSLKYTENGAENIQGLTDWGCASRGVCAGGIVPTCGSVFTDKRCGSCGGYDTCYWQVSGPTVVIDSSNTFQFQVSSAGYSFSVINHNFYDSEEYERNLIPSYPHYRVMDCPIKPGWMLATQDFVAGSTVNINSFAYPVNYFCKTMPVIMVNTTTSNRIKTDAGPYASLIAGNSLMVPSGEVWELFYVIRVTDDVPIICVPERQPPGTDGLCSDGTQPTIDGSCYVQTVYDTGTKKCVVYPGIIHFCREGIWDQASMSCVVQPDTHLICDPGTVYDTELQLCVYHPPVQAQCDNNTIYDPDLDKCVYTPERVAICPQNSTYDRALDMCKYVPKVTYTCTNVEGYSEAMYNDNGVMKCKYTVPGTKSSEPCPTYTLLGISQGDWTEEVVRDVNFCVIDKSNATCDQIPDSEWITGLFASGNCSVRQEVVYEYECENGYERVDDTTCVKNANPQYEPCVSGYVSTTPGLCVKTPTYDDTIKCPTGYTRVGDVCVKEPGQLVVCDPGYYYDAASGECARVMPNSQYCTDAGGRWDAATSKCYKPLRIDYEDCPEGYAWNDAKKQCEKPVLLRDTYICVEGTYDPITGTCKINSELVVTETQIKCTEGVYNSVTRKCEITPGVVVLDAELEQAKTTAIYVGLGVFIVLASIVAYVTLRRKI